MKPVVRSAWLRRTGRTEERGIGPRPISPRHLSVETLAAAIETAVTDTRMAERTRALGERIRAEDGVGRAVEAVQAAVTSGRPDRLPSLEVRGA
jgi:UDP:flavonoid glycosyltransferase YjiC (YdhE family)